MNNTSNNNAPFFILGCVRSGTTMLRDILKQHPRLECPEETHFYRWSDPCGSPRYDRSYITMDLFKQHRQLDGISDNDFHEIRRKADSRKELMQLYGDAFLNAQKNSNGRWFDKTPQNVYGIFLIAQDFPEAKFIHIHRNPLNVVASLVQGEVMASHSIKGAINYWMESLILISQFKKIYPERILEVSYEKLTSQLSLEVDSIFNFIAEDRSQLNLNTIQLHAEKNKYLNVLNKKEVAHVKSQTQAFLKDYGYD